MDIGGTFTDVVAYDEETGTYAAGKSSTTPGDLTEGVLAALSSVVGSPADCGFTVHGTTQGLNAFLQRRGERVLLLATAGAGDVYHIARGNRTRLYDIHFRKPEPLVDRADIVEISGRLRHDGSEIEALDLDAVRAAARRARDEGFGAVAVAFLFAYVNPEHELAAERAILEEIGDLPVSLSHRVAREWREYERTSSAVLDAYTSPVVRRYLDRLEAEMTARGLAVPLHVMQSSGGIVTAQSARQLSLQTLLSGPVGGTMGGVALARLLGRPNLICVDMGGTSFDVSLVVDGKPDVSSEASLEGFPLLMSVVNIHTIGAGGGSIAYEEAGGLRVGPDSAGADPGPACYGRGGTQPTVTDANLVLGRVDPAWFAGGQMTLDRDAADGAVASLAGTLGLEPVALAEGICDVINAKMAQAIRTLTVEKGIEPRDFALVAFGGAGPMHAVFLAQELEIGEVIVPRFPGAFSAWGMLETEIRKDFSRAYYTPLGLADLGDLAATFASLEAEAFASLEGEGITRETGRAEHALDIRYVGQEYTLTIPLLAADEPARDGFPQALADRFHEAHNLRFGHANPGAPVELVVARTTALGDLGRIEPEALAVGDGVEYAYEERPVVFGGGARPARVVRRDDLAPGALVEGPAVVVEQTATTVVPPGTVARIDGLGTLVVEVGGAAAARTSTDAITTEIIRSAFTAAADEMNATLIRSAYTPIIYEMKDCSVALLDADHRVLGQSAGLPIFLGNLEICTKLAEEMYGREVWEPGDVWIMNDSYLTGTHLNDMTVFGPIFHGDTLAGFAACRAHWLDVGAKDPGAPVDSTEIYQEGIRLGPTRVVAGGRQLRDVTDLLGRNSRFSYPAIGDLGAQIACVRTGQRRLSAIIDRYGTGPIAAARDEIFAQTERFERAAVTAVPDGTYSAEGCIDNDGVGTEPCWVRLTVEVRGDEMTIDLTRSDPAAVGPVNCGEAQAVSACRVAYKLLMNPDNPPNGGAFRPLSVKVRPGSLLGAQEPSPCQWYFTPLGLLIDLVVKALAEVLLEKAAGASYGDSMVIGLTGMDPRNGLPWLAFEPTVGGWGGWQGSDGQDGLINNVNGSLKDVAIEVMETKYPLRMTHYGFRADSGGAGRWRGGNGIVREYTLECDDTRLFLWFERSVTPGWGLFGGLDATPPVVLVNPGRPDEQRLLKTSSVMLRRGDVIRTHTGGGGGFGPPAERDPEDVRRDVRNRHVTPGAAKAVYGVEVGA
jgi:N-methylhydantoinase A